MAKPAFGTVEALKADTPQWAKWMFRILILLTTIVTFIIASDPKIPDELKVRIGVYLKGADMFVLGIAKMFGVSTDTENDNEIKN